MERVKTGIMCSYLKNIRQVSSATVEISPNICLYSAVPQNLSQNKISPDVDYTKKLIILLPWLYASTNAIKKYCSLYNSKGLDVLVVQENLRHFLQPSFGQAEAKNLLNLLTSGVFSSRSQILFHNISIGNYLYVLLLREIQCKWDQYKVVHSKIKGQIMDSPVIADSQKLINGILIVGQYGSFTTPIIKLSVKSYYALTKKWTLDFYEESFKLLKYSLIEGPLLLIYSKDDVMADIEALEELTAVWRQNKSIDLRLCIWENSLHAAHLITHPKDYCQHIDQFLQENLKIGLPITSKL